MRAAIWFVGLFAVAVALALFAGNNHGVVTLFWHPYRMDVSLNLALLILLSLFVLVYAAMRGFAALVQLPHQARRWRELQKERAMYQAMAESFSHLQAGRYVRARKSAQHMLKLHDDLRTAKTDIQHSNHLQAMAHMLAADSSHALRDTTARDAHYAQALELVPTNGTLAQQEVREGAQMRAARWALDDRDPEEALDRLAQLPLGAARRTMALRIKLKASRLARDTQTALDTARLLGKHGGFATDASASMIRSLLLEKIAEVQDPDQLQRLWSQLPAAEQNSADIILAVAHRGVALGTAAEHIRQWLLPLWERWLQAGHSLNGMQVERLLYTLQHALPGMDAAWLARIEGALRSVPQSPSLQHLAGLACVERQLWGKGEQLLLQAAPRLNNAEQRAQAWSAIAALAEQREDADAALHAWKQAALGLQPLPISSQK